MTTMKSDRTHCFLLLFALGATACLPIKLDDPTGAATFSTSGEVEGSTTADSAFTSTGEVEGTTTADSAFTSTGEVAGSTTADSASTGTGEVEGSTTADSASTGNGEVEGSTTADNATGTTDAPPGGECSPEALGEYGPEAWKEAADKLDHDALEPLQCPWNHEAACLAGPIPQLKTALVVRNDQLAAPRDIVLPNARWLVLSNLELGCADPFAAPLCAGEWRIAYPIDLPEWCIEIPDEGSFGYIIDFGMPLLIEFGDAECDTHTGTPQDADDHLVGLLFPPGELVPDDALPGQLCSLCQIPGVDAQIAGEFVAERCD